MTNTSVVLEPQGVVPYPNRTFRGYNVHTEDSFTNGSTNSTETQEYNWPVLCLFAIVIMALCGNILVCISVRVEKKLQNMFNYFLVSLAMSDMLSATLVMPLSIVKALINDTLPLPKLMCVAWYSLDVLFTSSTIIHLCMISVDRYMSLKYPLRYGRGKKTAHMAFKICLVWILAFCVAGPLFLFSMFDNQSEVYYKGCGPETPTFVISATVASFYLPLLIMTIMYIMTVQALNSQRKTQQKIVVTSTSSVNKDSSPHRNGARKASALSLSMFNGDGREMQLTVGGAGGGGGSVAGAGRSPLLGRKMYQYRKSTDQSSDGMDSDHLYAETLLDVPKSITPSSTYTDMTAGETDFEFRDMDTRGSGSGPRKLRVRTFHFKRSKEGSSRRGNMDKGRRAVQVLGVLFAVFVIFYLPFFATYTIRATCMKCRPYISPKMINGCEWLAYSASMVNPIIYHIFNPDFQRAFHKILRCKCSSL